MGIRPSLLTACITLLSTLSFAGKDATVVTGTGKVHDVVFLRMSNDTLYLHVPNPGATSYKVAGHKSRFKSVTFKDGSTFDNSRSYFDPDHPEVRESPVRAQEPVLPVSTPAQGDDVASSSTKPSTAQAPSAESTIAAEAWARFESVPYGPASDSQETTAPYRRQSPPARVTVTSTPPGATVIIDNTLLAGTTPFTLDSIASGPHTFRAVKDGVSASKTVSLRPRRTTRVAIEIRMPSTEPVKYRKR